VTAAPRRRNLFSATYLFVAKTKLIYRLPDEQEKHHGHRWKDSATPLTSDTQATYYKDATELAALIRTKQLSSREVVQAHLDRIKTINPKVNAIVTLLAEEALEGADAADKAVKNGETLGPLHGVPFTIKDAIDTAGVLTQRASKIFAGNIPEKDATVMTRFKAAGAIPLPRPTFLNSRPGRKQTI
jgi:Amidase